MTPFGNLASAVKMADLAHNEIAVPFLRGKVLLIEDEAVIALDMANDLESWSYDVIGVAQSMEQALRAAEKYRPHVAIVDIMLRSEHDGIEIAEVLKEKYGTRIVFLTAHSDPATTARVVKLNPMGYLYKPYSAFALRQLLETYEID